MQTDMLNHDKGNLQRMPENIAVMYICRRFLLSNIFQPIHNPQQPCRKVLQRFLAFLTLKLTRQAINPLVVENKLLHLLDEHVEFSARKTGLDGGSDRRVQAQVA
jgi:hypothetical protein